MKVVCINNYNRIDDIYRELTIGKIYETLKETPEYYYVINDSGSREVFYSWRFMDLKKYRKLKLKKLNESNLCKF